MALWIWFRQQLPITEFTHDWLWTQKYQGLSWFEKGSEKERGLQSNMKTKQGEQEKGLQGIIK